MRVLRWIPGFEHWRLGQRRKGSILLGLFALFTALLVWRAELLLRLLSHVTARFSGESTPPMPRSLDLSLSILVVIGILAGLVVISRRASRRLLPPDAGSGKSASVRPSASVEGVESPWRALRQQYARNRLAVMGTVVVLVVGAISLLCPLLTSHDPLEQGDIVDDMLLEPSLEHLLGTDDKARDVLSRVLYGSRVSLLVGVLSVALAITVGTLYGAIAGFYGGRIDGVMMRVVDMFLAFPSLVLIITVVYLWDDHAFWVIIVVLGLLSWMKVARLVRGQFLTLKEREFFLAARSLGAGTWRLVFRHLLPNAFTPILVFATLGVGDMILVESALSYLGLGVQPPTPSWGNIVYEYKTMDPWWITVPAFTAIVVTVVGFNLLGDGLRDVLDPRQRS